MWIRKALTFFLFLGLFGPLVADRIAQAYDNAIVPTEWEVVAEETTELRSEHSFLDAILASDISLNQQFFWTKLSEFEFVVPPKLLDFESTVRGPPSLS